MKNRKNESKAQIFQKEDSYTKKQREERKLPEKEKFSQEKKQAAGESTKIKKTFSKKLSKDGNKFVFPENSTSRDKKKWTGKKQESGKPSTDKFEKLADVDSNQKWMKNKQLKSAERTKNRHANSGKNSACPIMKKCGGCCYQDIPYKEQLEIKQKSICRLLGAFGRVEPILGMENPFHYRNKVHAVFARKKDGSIISGVYEEGTHKVLPVDKCLIENEKADEIIRTIRDLVKSFKIKIYNEDSEYGLLRHVLVRVGRQSKEIMVVLVLASPVMPSKNNFVKALRKAHPEITTIVVNVNDKRTSMVLGDKEQVIYGKGYIEDTLCGSVFRISPKSFYQVNSVQTEKLYRKALEFAGLTGKETVLDAYCGIGTIGIIASGFAKEVIGVELNLDAVRDAKINAKRNGIENISFYHNDAGVFITELAEQHKKIDVVFMDPPRAGSDEAFLSSVAKLMPEKIVYISCNPLTLERDLKYLVKHGYRVERMVPVDMFAGTNHVETIVSLSRK